MPQGVDRPVAKSVSLGVTPLDVDGGGAATLISNGAGGGPGGGGGAGVGGGGVGDGMGVGAGVGEPPGGVTGGSVGDGAGLGDGPGDGVGDAIGAASSPPPQATRPVPLATERDSVKKSALRLIERRHRGPAIEAV